MTKRDIELPARRAHMVLYNRPLGYLVMSVFLSRLVGSMLTVAVPFYVIEKFGFGIEAGVTLAARLLPSVLLGIVVGHFVDKWDPRRTAIYSTVIASVLLALVPLTGVIWQLQILMFVIGLVQLFSFPARMALRPLAIPTGGETRGNAAIVTAERLSGILGPLLVGLLIATSGLGIGFFLQSGVSIVSALLILGLPARPFERDAPGSLGEEFRAMLITGPKVLARAVFGDPMLRVVVLTAFTYVAATAIGEVFIVGLAKESFPTVPGANGVLVAAMGAGGVLGALMSSKLERFSPGRLYLTGNVLEGVAWGTLPFLHNLPGAAVVMVIAGCLESVATVVYFAEVQKRLPDNLVGKFFATFVPLTDIFSVLGMVGAPVFMASMGVTGTAMIIAGLIAVPVLAFAPTLVRHAVPVGKEKTL